MHAFVSLDLLLALCPMKTGVHVFLRNQKQKGNAAYFLSPLLSSWNARFHLYDLLHRDPHCSADPTVQTHTKVVQEHVYNILQMTTLRRDMISLLPHQKSPADTETEPTLPEFPCSVLSTGPSFLSVFCLASTFLILFSFTLLSVSSSFAGVNGVTPVSCWCI